MSEAFPRDKMRAKAFHPSNARRLIRKCDGGREMQTHRLTAPIAGSLNALLDRGPAALACIARWLDRARQRSALAALDERLLRDIGHDRADVAREVAKPFWQP